MLTLAIWRHGRLLRNALKKVQIYSDVAAIILKTFYYLKFLLLFSARKLICMKTSQIFITYYFRVDQDYRCV